eukprot:COSAG05_NODE_1751_length_4143_cov_2.852621_1_plen_82_part_00
MTDIYIQFLCAHYVTISECTRSKTSRNAYEKANENGNTTTIIDWRDNVYREKITTMLTNRTASLVFWARSSSNWQCTPESV